jgi:hypothetical protein
MTRVMMDLIAKGWVAIVCGDRAPGITVYTVRTRIRITPFSGIFVRLIFSLVITFGSVSFMPIAHVSIDSITSVRVVVVLKFVPVCWTPPGIRIPTVANWRRAFEPVSIGIYARMIFSVTQVLAVRWGMRDWILESTTAFIRILAVHRSPRH